MNGSVTRSACAMSLSVAISARLQVSPSTLSRHLAVLERTGLLGSRRLRRQIFCVCAYEVMRDLLEYLTNSCRQNLPALCGFMDRLANTAYAPMKKDCQLPNQGRS